MEVEGVIDLLDIHLFTIMVLLLVVICLLIEISNTLKEIKEASE